ncbi:polyhydroxyalkanoate synthesis repressor PhaR [Amorphus sp. MBR-141]
MAKTDNPTVIKKYANRRLYNTGTSTYVTLEDLAEMVKAEEDFVVFDAKSGDEITRSVLTQIIFEQENKGQNLLPIAFLRQLIGFYGDSMQNIVPSYLEYSLQSFVRDQEKLRKQMTSSFGVSPFDTLDEQVRRNTEMFEKAMRMFIPFGAAGEEGTETPAGEEQAGQQPAGGAASELDEMKRQMADMQKTLNALTGFAAPGRPAKGGKGSGGKGGGEGGSTPSD